MTSISDQEFAQTEVLLRQRLAQLANHAPTAVHLPDEVAVVAANRPIGRGRRAGMITAIAALIGAGGFTTYSFLGAASDGGAATPEEAVTTFVAAMENEDVLGMVDVTLPEEVGALRAAVDSITSDAKRVDLLGADFDASGVQGLDIAVDGLALETNFLEGGLAVVSATNGTISASFDPQAFQFGGKARELIGNGEVLPTATTDLVDSDVSVMTVERHGRWYVSLEYTVAELIRQANAWEFPGPVARTPIGSDSPEQAVTGFYERLATLDLQSAIDTFAPGEDATAWLAQSWITDAQAAIDRGRANGWSVQISGLSYETIGDGDHLTLRPTAYVIQGTTPAEFNQDILGPADGPQPFTISLADDCLTFTGPIGESMFGSEATAGVATRVDGGYRLCGSAGSILGGLGLLVAGSGVELPPVAVTLSGDQWYVSPLGTILGSLTINMHDLVDGSSLFESAFAPFIYGGLSRDTLELMVVAQSAGSIDPGCLPALTVEGGLVTGVVADPPLDAIRVCAATVSFGIGESSGTSSGPAVSEVPPTPETVASTP